MTHEQYERLLKLSYSTGAHQEMLNRIKRRVQEKDGHIYALVLATDMSLIRQVLEKKEEGLSQDLFREIFESIGPEDA